VPDKREFIIDAIILFLKSYNPIVVVGKPFLKNKGAFHRLTKSLGFAAEEKSFSALVIILFANNYKFTCQNNA